MEPGLAAKGPKHVEIRVKVIYFARWHFSEQLGPVLRSLLFGSPETSPNLLM